MKREKAGFTLIELLVVIAIIGILAAILLPTLSGIQRKSIITETKTTVRQLAQAMKAYEVDHGTFPPNDGAQEGTTFKYYDGSFVAYLDGDVGTNAPKATKTSKIQYYEFKLQYIDTTPNPHTYKDRFDGKFWYHNFRDDPADPNVSDKDKKVIDTSRPLHPWYNRIRLGEFQIYSKIDREGDIDDAMGPYEGASPRRESEFKWATNYSD